MVRNDSGDDDFSFVLDDDFVAGATITELSAKERKRAKKKAVRQVRRRRRRRRLRRPATVLASLLILALAAGVGFGLAGQGPWASLKRDDPLAGGPPTVTGSAPGSRSGTSTTIGLQARTYSPGECVIWDQAPGNTGNRATHVVSCAEPHIIEITTSLTMSTPFDHYPTSDEWDRAISLDCDPPAVKFLGMPLDPAGRFYSSAIYPLEASWASGGRTLHCGIKQRSLEPSNAADESIPVFSGEVKGATQQAIFPVGACRVSGAFAAVPCDTLHDYEVTGNVDLTGRVAEPPAVDDTSAWNALVGEECTQLATAYLGRPLDADLIGYWYPMRLASWRAGGRVVQCIVARYDADGPIPLHAPLRPAP